MTSTPALGRYERTYGVLLGLAYGDALGFPAMFHRTFQFPVKRRDFLWNTNRELARERIIRLTLPFTHRIAPSTLEPFPTDDTEYAVFTAITLLNADGPVDAATLLKAWQMRIVPTASTLLTGFAERSAIENLRRGVLPPASGNDNPQHYDDSAVCRAVAIGLFCTGDPDRAAMLAQAEAQITNAEDGVYAAQAMAAAIALLASGAPLSAALAHAQSLLPTGSWIAHGAEIAQQCRMEAENVQDLLLLLSTRLINTVYSFGNAAPETLPAAFVIAEACGGDLQTAVLLANSIPKSADSLPAMVGALCGAVQGPTVLSARWREQLNICRGLCLPLVADARLDDLARRLAAQREGATVQQHAGNLDTMISKRLALRYLLWLPSDYDQSNAQGWPLIVFLHGRGERGDDLALVEKHGLARKLVQGFELPAIVAAPQCPAASDWTLHDDAMLALIDDLCSSYRVDQDRIYLTGLSMGGRGTWRLAAEHTERFAAIVPICGRRPDGVRSPEDARRLCTLPIWVFHGAEDQIVPMAESDAMVTALRVHGTEVRYTLYPDVGHDSWTRAYNEPDLYVWLFNQRRTVW